MFTAALLLLTAIGVEVASTAALPRTESFTQPGWTAAVLGGFALSIWLLSVVVRTIPVSVAYAVWSGVGTAVVAVVGFTLLGETVSWVKIASLALIVAGVVGLNFAAA